jgi:AcrR family transcriptional regulator
MPVSTRRPYRSNLREEQAHETRLRIRKSARKLFASKGFTETTINEIAENAGVAPQTVYSVFGSKGGIVAAILEDLQESAGESLRVAEMISEEDPHRQLRLFISWIRTFFEQGAPIVRAALAAQSDADVAALTDQGDQNRRNGTRTLAEIWAGKGTLREGIEHEDAAQQLWLLTSAEQYILATDKLGWSPDQYEQWLGDLLERELLKRP